MKASVNAFKYGYRLEQIAKISEAQKLKITGRTVEYVLGAINEAKTVPFLTGQLQNSAETTVQGIGTATIDWNQNYAKRIYYGNKLNFNTQSNPFAQAYWDRKITQNDAKMNLYFRKAMRIYLPFLR